MSGRSRCRHRRSTGFSAAALRARCVARPACCCCSSRGRSRCRSSACLRTSIRRRATSSRRSPTWCARASCRSISPTAWSAISRASSPARCSASSFGVLIGLHRTVARHAVAAAQVPVRDRRGGVDPDLRRLVRLRLEDDLPGADLRRVLPGALQHAARRAHRAADSRQRAALARRVTLAGAALRDPSERAAGDHHRTARRRGLRVPRARVRRDRRREDRHRLPDLRRARRRSRRRARSSA